VTWTVDYVHLGAQVLAAARRPAGMLPVTLCTVGSGAGTVATTPGGITCGAGCATASPAFGKQAPLPGASGLGNTVTLQ
jgi:ribose 5-phosphate isomerase RpiB